MSISSTRRKQRLCNPSNKRWSSDPALTSLLIFAQSIEEKLYDYTIDSYRARALNLHTSSHEMVAISHLATRASLDKGNLGYILDEFRSHIESDPVISQSDRETLGHYIGRLESLKSNPEEFKALAQAANMEISATYGNRLRQLIIKTVIENNNHELIPKLIDSLICELELEGFNRTYIFKESKYFFWKKKVETADLIRDFIDLFSKPPQKFHLYIKSKHDLTAISPIAESFGIDVNKYPEAEPEDVNLKEFFTPQEKTTLLSITGILARDPFSARLNAEKHLKWLSNVCSFVSHHEELGWEKIAASFTEAGDFCGFTNLPMQPVKRCAHRPISESREEIDQIIDVFMGPSFHRSDREQFYKALEYHRAALETNTPENQLVDLWAALEGFLPSPKGDSSRIQHYIKTVLPSITLSYPEKIFDHITHSLMATNNEANEFVSSLTSLSTPLEKVTALLVCSDLENERNHLFTAIANNPLLLIRCKTISGNFKTRTSAAQTLKSHRGRVERHLQRIYASRNLIVHDADSLPYLNTLIENLHFYVDSLMRAIIKVGTRSKFPTSIDASIRLLSTSEAVFLSQVSRKTSSPTENDCNLNNFKEVIFGASNPLSPFKSGLSLE